VTAKISGLKAGAPSQRENPQCMPRILHNTQCSSTYVPCILHNAPCTVDGLQEVALSLESHEALVAETFGHEALLELLSGLQVSRVGVGVGVYMSACACACLCVCVRVHGCGRGRGRGRVGVGACVSVCTCVHACKYMCTHVCVCARADVHALQGCTCLCT